VSDVVEANLLVATKNSANNQAYNVGTGKPVRIADFARKMCEAYGKTFNPIVSGWYRPGEVRHIFADNTKISKLGWKPKITLEQGITAFAGWIEKQKLPNPTGLEGLVSSGVIRKSDAGLKEVG
jgi:nucleoside-diphosphate-sugar epimerase